MWNAGQEEPQAGIKIVRSDINYIIYAEHSNLIAESKAKLKSFLMNVKVEWKSWSKTQKKKKINIQKTKIVASGPVTSWQIDGETMETPRDFIFVGSKITADGDYSHEIKRFLLLERQTMTKLDTVLKSRDITLLTKVYLVKAMVFPVFMLGFEIWTIKKAEHWKIDAFELCC